MPGDEESRTGKETVLFICSFNSVRSQIAEGLLRARCGDRFEIFSAGIAPAGLNPYAVTVMKEIGIDISHQRGKSLNRFSGRTFTYVITLCDHARLALAGSLPVGLYTNHHAFISPFRDPQEQGGPPCLVPDTPGRYQYLAHGIVPGLSGFPS